MEPSFIHLRVHSEYSLVDGLVRIKPLVQAAIKARMPAVAVTDQTNLFALVKFYQAALKGGIKPIIGVDCWLRNPLDANKPSRLLLLVQNASGYHNLTNLISRSYLEGQHLGRPMLQREWLDNNSTGLIALSGGREGDVGAALLSGNQKQAEELLDGWLKLFGDRYYLELNRTGRAGEEDLIHASVELALQWQVPVVATNDVRFLHAADFAAHEVRVCIHSGRTLDDPRRPRDYSEQQYLRSQEEMAELFADIPEALENSVEIAKRCNLELTLGENYLPDFPVPAGMTLANFFIQSSNDGLEQRLETILDPTNSNYVERRRIYTERLQLELDVIIEMGFPGYFLIVADFIRWARENGIPVGPGRGSGAGSLVAYALKITDLDPLEYDLLFERFLNPERVSMPDFDIDFCMDGRDRVIEYVADRYGRDAVSQIITYGSMAAKAVVRDVGRVLGHPYGFVDRIAKLIPFELGITLDDALQDGAELNAAYRDDEEVAELIDMAKKLEGLVRNAGKHAGGVVIAPSVLTDFTPLYCEPGGDNLVTQLDKDDIEAVGLVKFDFLGLRTLTIVNWAVETINQGRLSKGEPVIDIGKIPMDDPAAFKLLKSAATTAIFQLESRGMKELIQKLQPDSFDEIIALVALYRPGPLQSGMVDDYVARKHGRQQVVYPHPALEPILKPTYGIILYQEQVMQIAQVLAGYTMGSADLLRRAMGKKKHEEMAKQGEIFRQGAQELGVDEKVATYVFDLMEKFAGYGFNKSHSAAYAVVSYQTLWLKAHHPAAFMSAVLSADMDHTDKVVIMIDECRAMQLEVKPPDINYSHYKFVAAGENTVIYGLGAVKGVGEAAISGIVTAREDAGLFTDLFDFCHRIDLHKANRRVLEALIRSGAMDALGGNRASLMAQLPLALKMAEQHHSSMNAGQSDLFGMAEPGPVIAPNDQIMPHDVDDWSDEQRLQGEKDTLGLYLTGHPIDRYESELAGIGAVRIGSILQEGATAPNNGGSRRRHSSRQVMIAGLAISVSHRQTQRGRMGTVLLDDKSGRIEATLFSETYESYRDLLTTDNILVIVGSTNYDEYRGGMGIRVDQVYEFEQARSVNAQAIRLSSNGVLLQEQGLDQQGFLHEMEAILSPYLGGGCGVCMDFRQDGASVLLEFGEEWRVNPTDELLRRLEGFSGVSRVDVIYGKSGG